MTRLIDAEALKEALAKEIKTNDMGLWLKILLVIDNAPTVEPEKPPCNQIAWEQGYEAGVAQGKSERPQGEWIKWAFKSFGALGDWEYKCSNCEKVYSGEYNFCPNCGADMRSANNG